MADINEQNDLYPSIDDIESLEIALRNQEEYALDREEDQDDAVEGIGYLGRARCKLKRKTRRVRRSKGRNSAFRRSYSAGAKSTAVKTGSQVAIVYIFKF